MNKVLVIDDDVLLLNAMEFLFKNKGYRSLTISNTVDVFKHIDHFEPDIILLDVYLAGEDGRDFCLDLKSREASKNIPVIILSGDYRVEENIQQYGADNFLLKPFKIDELFEAIESHLSASPMIKK